MYWESAVLLNRLEVVVGFNSCYTGWNTSFNKLYCITDQAAQRSCSRFHSLQLYISTCRSDHKNRPWTPTFRYVISYSSRLARVNIIGGSLLLVLQVNTMLH